MKRTVQLVLICLLVLLLPVAVSAAAAAASVTGPTTIRAGNTLTVAILMNGTGLSAVQGEVQYDSSQLTFQSTSSTLANWDFTISGTTAGKITFIGIDSELKYPISSNKQLFKATFQVKSGVAAGAVIRVTAAKLSASDGTNDFSPANASYSVTVAAPASTNANLSSLTVNSGTLTPAFAKATTSYTLSVPFSVQKITVTAKAEDAGAKVSINSPDLAAGSTTDVTVKVTAASGATKTYTIQVSRGADPNYVPSGVNDLASLTVASAQVSPVFSKEKLEYIVYVPFEMEKIEVAATPEDSKAKVSVEGNENLQVGKNNLVKITCTAENGTAKAYTLVAVRAAAFNGIASLVTPTPTPLATTVATTTAKPTTTATTAQATTTATQTIASTTTAEQPNPTKNQTSTGLIILIIVLFVLVAAEAGYIIYLRRNFH
jgi:hypothetical protein